MQDGLRVLAQLTKRELCVDVGCGPGQSTELYCPFFKNVVGADISHSQIEEANARRRYGNVTYMEASAECLPLRSSSVALMSAVNAIQWFDQDAFFAEVRRVLVENGVLFAAMHHLRALLEPGMDNWLFQLRKDKFSDYLLSRHMYWDEGYDNIEVPFKGVRRKTMLTKSALTVSAVMDHINTWSLVIMMREHEPERAEATLAEFRDRSWKCHRLAAYRAVELAKKTSSRTQDADSRRRERKFTKLLEFLMPLYLLPFVFGNTEGVGIYCVLLTLACLTGGLLPPAVAAMVPLVILPLAGILTPDQVAAEFLGPRVLAAWLLFAIVIVGDETTVFARACLYALQRFALRMQPLFLSLQLVVLALSLFLPSSFIVVLCTVFIERFVAIVQREIFTVDQRSGLRAPTNSSTQNFIEDIRRQRWQRRMATGGSARKARSVSLPTETDMVTDMSGSSSLVHQYKLHPEWLKEGEAGVQQKGTQSEKKLPRKTSFNPFDHTSDSGGVLACRLPTRTIRSFASQKVEPSSILKGSSSKCKGMDSRTPSPCRTASASPTKSSKSVVTLPNGEQLPGSKANVVRTVEPDDEIFGGPSRTPSPKSPSKAKEEPAKKASVKLVDEPVAKHPAIQQATSGSVDKKRQDSLPLVKTGSAQDDGAPTPVEDSPGQQELRQTSTTPMTLSTSPFQLSSRSSTSLMAHAVIDVWNTASVSAGGVQSVDSYATWASHVMSGPGSQLLLPGAEEAPASSPLAKSSESTTMKSAAEDQQQLSPSTESSKSVIKWNTALSSDSEDDAECSGWKLLQLFHGLHTQTTSEVCNLQKKAPSPSNSRSQRPFEVRGVLKPARSSTSMQSSPKRESPTSCLWSVASMDNDTDMAATMNGGVAMRRRVMYDSTRRRTATAGRSESGTSARRIVIAPPQSYLAGDAASSYREHSHVTP
ncbi:hypothetical protein HPB50_006262 [Hyalomma asiaticum]|uniref:Uncharacterized protein n=1 Tax=Hyalomma asiaticum TaxID=266040 RepID=A0ACB7SEI6_HYAAI|nr:hypothetical protein HPB50_006262 [Hyalomma asiaticum]